MAKFALGSTVRFSSCIGPAFSVLFLLVCGTVSESIVEQDKELYFMVRKGDVGASEALLVKGANPNGFADTEGWTALLRASYSGRQKLVQALLDKGADTEAHTKQGETALIWAINNGHLSSVQTLLGGGASLTSVQRNGDTPLIRACIGDHASIVSILLAAGAKTEEKNHLGQSPLLMATFYGRSATVKELLDAGAEKEGTNKRGKTALILASYQGHAATVRELLRVGAATNTQDQSGKTAFDYAVDKNHQEIVDLLSGLPGSDPSDRDEPPEVQPPRLLEFNHAQKESPPPGSHPPSRVEIPAANSRGGEL